ncbi:putative nucleotidyltransferase, ribonuclease H [Tanacetum coccineum]
MDVVTKLSRTKKKHDVIWVIVDRLKKSAHFITIQENMLVHKLAKIYVNEIIARHGVPVSIVSDRDGRFTSNFWRDFQEELGTKLHMSTTFYPQTDGQSNRIIQTLEDMLRACVIDFGGNWDDHLPLEEVGSRELASTYVVLATTKKIETIRERLKAAQDRWKSYADNRRRPIVFKVGDFVMLKVLPWKGVFRFKTKGKLSPRFIGPFKILKRVGEVAYVLELPEEMRGIHNTFHVSYLRKCLADESSMITLDDIEINPEITTQEEPVAILGRKSRQLRNKQIPLVKVQWKHSNGTSIRWEPEEKKKINLPCFVGPSGLDKSKEKKWRYCSSILDLVSRRLSLDQRNLEVEAPRVVCCSGLEIVKENVENYVAKPTENYLTTVKRVFWYLKGTINMGLWYPKDIRIKLTAYTDADHAGCQDTRRSTSGSAQFIGEKLVS